MKCVNILFHVTCVISMLSTKDIQKYLTKKSSISWVFNQTQMLNPENHYCSICCVDIRQQENGRKCGIHTMCIYETKPIGANCRGLIVMEFSKNEIEAIVDIHNTLRNKVAIGMETDGDPGPQPPAANMRIITWDTELANVASRWATQCVYSYDRCRDLYRFPVGQNIAKANYASKSDIEYIAEWYELVEFISTDNITSYTLNEQEDIGHYTQLVWADTYLVGCARICFQKAVSGQIIYREHFFCNYGPSGNIPGQPVYKIGEPCSGCLEGTGCLNPEYPALCGNELIDETNFTRQKRLPKLLDTKNNKNDINKTIYVNSSFFMVLSCLLLHVKHIINFCYNGYY